MAITAYSLGNQVLQMQNMLHTLINSGIYHIFIVVSYILIPLNCIC